MAIKKTQIYQSLWDACDELRGGMDASQYKNYILTLLFVKYVTDKYLGNPYAEITVFDKEHDPEPDVDKKVGCSFNDLVELKNDSNIGEGIDKVVSRLAEANPSLKGIIDKDNYFNDKKKFGTGREMVETLTSLISIFQRPELDFKNNKAGGDDIIGDAYEYLMRKFATESGKSKGQFYTPAEVSRVLTLILELDKVNRNNYKNGLSIYDCSCGSGSLIIRAMDALPNEVKNISSGYGQEKDTITAGLAKMNAVLHNKATIEIRDGNTFSDPKFKENDNEEELKTFNFIVANPPFSLKNWTKGYKDYGRLLDYQEPPKKNGDYAWVLHIIKSLKSNGRASVILPLGVLSRGNAEYNIRKKIIDKGLIKGIIALPANLFYGTGIPACILVLDKQDASNRDGIFMIDATKGFKKDGNKNRLREEDIYRITNTFVNRIEDDKTYARFVGFDEIKNQNDYNLNISRYIENSNAEENQDIEGHIKGGIPDSDIDRFNVYFDEFANLKSSLFNNLRSGYKELKVNKEDIREVIHKDVDYIEYQNKFNKIIKSYRKLAFEILNNIDNSVDTKELIKLLSEKLISDFAKLSLLNKYDCYEVLLQYWNEVMNDDVLVVKLNGFEFAKSIEKQYKELKKKKNENDDKKTTKDKQVLGFDGLLIPKELVINEFFLKEKNNIEEINNQIQKLEEEIEEMINDAEEDCSLYDIIVDGKIKETDLKAKIKELEKEADIKGDDKTDYDLLIKYKNCIDGRKEKVTELKNKGKELEDLVFKKYDKLTIDEIKELLINKKWLDSIEKGLTEYYQTLSEKLTEGIETIVDRYEETFIDIEAKLKNDEKLVLKDLKTMGFEM